MLHSAYKHFSCVNLAKVTSKNDSKTFKVAPVDGTHSDFCYYCIYRTILIKIDRVEAFFISIIMTFGPMM